MMIIIIIIIIINNPSPIIVKSSISASQVIGTGFHHPHVLSTPCPLYDKQIPRLALVTSAQVNKVHHLIDAISGPTVYYYCLFDQIMRQFLRECYTP